MTIVAYDSDWVNMPSKIFCFIYNLQAKNMYILQWYNQWYNKTITLVKKYRCSVLAVEFCLDWKMAKFMWKLSLSKAHNWTQKHQWKLGSICNLQYTILGKAVNILMYFE